MFIGVGAGAFIVITTLTLRDQCYRDLKRLCCHLHGSLPLCNGKIGSFTVAFPVRLQEGVVKKSHRTPLWVGVRKDSRRESEDVVPYLRCPITVIGDNISNKKVTISFSFNVSNNIVYHKFYSDPKYILRYTVLDNDAPSTLLFTLQ